MDFAWLVAEDKIKTSMKNGEFDDLPGKGKPKKLDDLSMIPEELRIAYKVLKNSGYLPENVQLQKELVSLEELLRFCGDEEERMHLKKRISEKSYAINSSRASDDPDLPRSIVIK
ncbi:DUF1992 domain-containing protein [Pseudalkalibacillus hwajinpoensis]|uniref:DnaJ family domain-containing protein n=1 Tax=Guptibacillus hwajinpoensis TaxID=208199 RepID=UPI00325AEE0C